jgi:hypothetical protein
MPFTLSHAAAAWPFRRTRLVFSALIVGCFVPDIPYFLLLRAHGFNGHTLSGLFTFDLPAGLLALWLFHRYGKQVSLIYLPAGFRRRLKFVPFSFLPPARLALIAASILMGAATHILWDSFTHKFYWSYGHWSFLRVTVPFPVVHQLEMYKLLQYVSTVFGIVFLAIWVWHWYRSTAPARDPIVRPFPAAQKIAMLAILPLVSICGGILRAHEAIRIVKSITSIEYFVVDAVVTAITIFGLGFLACGIVFRRNQTATGEHLIEPAKRG